MLLILLVILYLFDFEGKLSRLSSIRKQ